jgi:hypothetical protein
VVKLRPDLIGMVDFSLQTPSRPLKTILSGRAMNGRLKISNSAAANI